MYADGTNLPIFSFINVHFEVPYNVKPIPYILDKNALLNEYAHNRLPEYCKITWIVHM